MKNNYVATSQNSSMLFDFLMGMGVFTIVLALLLAVSTDAWSIQHTLDAAQVGSSHDADMLTLSDRHLAFMVMALMFSLITVVVKRSAKHLHQIFGAPRRKVWGRR